MRLVLLETNSTNTFHVYEGKECLASFTFPEGEKPLTPEEVEFYRTADYKDKA